MNAADREAARARAATIAWDDRNIDILAFDAALTAAEESADEFCRWHGEELEKRVLAENALRAAEADNQRLLCALQHAGGFLEFEGNVGAAIDCIHEALTPPATVYPQHDPGDEQPAT